MPRDCSCAGSGRAPGCLPGLGKGLLLLLAWELSLQRVKDSPLSLLKSLGLSPFLLHLGYYLCLEHCPTAPFYLPNSYSSFMSQFKCHSFVNKFSSPHYSCSVHPLPFLQCIYYKLLYFCLCVCVLTSWSPEWAGSSLEAGTISLLLIFISSDSSPMPGAL